MLMCIVNPRQKIIIIAVFDCNCFGGIIFRTNIVGFMIVTISTTDSKLGNSDLGKFKYTGIAPIF